MSPAQTIFPGMVLRNATGLSTVYRKVYTQCIWCVPWKFISLSIHLQAEQLFRRLSQAKEVFNDWVILGCVDIEALVETNCTTVSDWENNIRTLKAKGREAEKLPK